MTITERAGNETEALRDCLARWPSGVAVVTTMDRDGARRGFTATAFSSLSSSPPLVLVCLDRSADCSPAFDAAEAMAVHLLRDDQEQLAMRFATKGADKYAGLPSTPGLARVPLLDGVLARLECELVNRFDGGDHVILIGRVRRSEVFAGQPLIYCGRAFRSLPPAESPA
ncbi:flavin reductase family protein [Streptomyces rubradiris]|uniref:Actinorhodin polyketide dimerase n=1 Tax=Streptomyces rubradiris TaxID=285531 RepID=A0ABQ3RHZ0_STRRR|nr:flavin reductase family protein [Streptomyces rubradiris]GHH20991.1 actinorhodin polyketide dimerase [Streptomyces rubradiris]GHI55473.1 actinorhodin polyketide dimerase [Streptomyces rubradiris]